MKDQRYNLFFSYKTAFSVTSKSGNEVTFQTILSIFALTNFMNPVFTFKPFSWDDRDTDKGIYADNVHST